MAVPAPTQPPQDLTSAVFTNRFARSSPGVGERGLQRFLDDAVRADLSVHPDGRVRVAAVNDFEIIVAGLAEILEKFRDRLVVCDRIVMGDPIDTPIDVALYDTYGRVGIAAPALRTLAQTPGITYVAMFSLDLSPDLVAEGRAAGATGFISKSLCGAEIADALVLIAQGQSIVAATAVPRPPSQELSWPGKDVGLTVRESQVLVLAAEGLSNREIGAAIYLSAETVKGYLRQAFLKLKVRNRVEATNYVRATVDFARYQAPYSAPAGGRDAVADPA